MNEECFIEQFDTALNINKLLHYPAKRMMYRMSRHVRLEYLLPNSNDTKNGIDEVFLRQEQDSLVAPRY